MKKSVVQFICVVFIISIGLAACGSGDESESEAGVEQTMTAFSHTQTAFAQESQSEEPSSAETQAPQVEEEPVETEGVAEEVTEAPTEIAHTLTPGEPGWVYKTLNDTDASGQALTAGDDFVANLYERPFTETEMVYRPDVDINKTEIGSDADFFYVTIYLNGQNPDGGLQGIYGVELDFDLDGRGDMLILADHPTSTDWDIAGVSVYTDPNGDVGGNSIMRPDTGYSGDGYENVVFSMDVLDDPDTAWARVNPSDPPSVNLAFKKTLLPEGNTFVWGVWATDSLLDPAMIDLHDHFTQTEAGSPYQSHSEYPLAALNLVDNTCRETYGFDATSSIAGLCYVPQEPTSQPGGQTEPDLGSISYVVFFDSNSNGVRDATELLFEGGNFTVELHAGACSAGVIGSSGANSHTFPGLDAGAYCIEFVSAAYGCSTPEVFNLTLGAGGTKHVEFGVVFN